MAAYITEDQKSRKMSIGKDSASTTRIYHMFDYVDTDAALNALSNYVPLQVQVGDRVCSIGTLSVDPSFSDPNKTLFKGTVSWETPATSGEGEPVEPEDNTSFSFSFSSIEDVKLYSGNQTSYTSSGQNNDEEGINRQYPDAMPEGMAINKPIVTFDAKTVIAGNVASNNWFKARLDQVWTLNQSTFRSLPPRSVAFTGLSGSIRSDGNWDITYSFEYRPNNSGQTFKTETEGTPSTITTPDSGGWDYVWSAWDKLSVPAAGGAEKKTKRVIRSVSITKDVYPSSDFNQLGMVGV